MGRLAPVVCLLVIAGCAPHVRRSGMAPTSAQMAQLWIDPGAGLRDLLGGPAGTLGVTERPDPDMRYDIVERDTAGFSITDHVRDARASEWNVKIGPEAQTGERLAEVTDRQWQDAFAAGNVEAATTSRYVARIKRTIAEGLALR